MNRTLRRPMFRMGGSTGTGITSGLDTPRKQYNQGTDPYDRALSTTERAVQDLEKFRGEKQFLSPGTLPSFLTQFGLNLASQTPTGNIFSTAATAAKEPFQQYQAQQMMERQRKADRAEDLFSGALASEYDLEEQRIKNLAEGDDARKTAEVEMGIIKDAQQIIFDQQAILDDPTATAQEKNVARQQIKINQNVLTKELGVSPEYAAIIGNEDLFDNAMDGYVELENAKRIKDYTTDNPNASPKEIQDNVVLITKGSQEAMDLTFAELQERYGYNDGGRVGLAFGTKPMMPAVAEAPEEQVQDLSYNELRSRLPQEISNDIVQLLANSKQALMDFANIQTGEDIASFNQQYDVNLTLPQGA
jgi:hypothetical protein